MTYWTPRMQASYATLLAAVQARAEADAAIAHAVSECERARVRWQDIGAALGIAASTAHNHYSRRAQRQRSTTAGS